MNSKIIEKYFFVLFSIIPISIIAGPSVSLANILLICLSFICYIFYLKDFKFFKDKTVKWLFFLYLYLIFNSFISLDPSLGLYRNFGFIRFIVLFIAFNFFFYRYQNFKKIFLVWFIIISIITFDVFIESYSGTNIVGYGARYGERIVSFFKDEPIVGAYLNAFYLLIIGYLFLDYKKKNNKYKFLIGLFVLIIFCAIVLTGERSSTIRAFIGLFIFYFLNNNFSAKHKILLCFLSITFFLIIYSNSSFLKLRYGDQILLQFSSKERLQIFLRDNPYALIYKSGVKVFKNYPIFGVGAKNYRLETCHKKNSGKYYCVTHPHEIYLEFLSEHGVVGATILLSILFYLIFRILKIILISKNYIQLGCFSYLILKFIPLLPSGAFFNDLNATFFWLNFSIMYAVNTKTNIFR